MTDVPKQALSDLWQLAGGAPETLEKVALTGEEPVLPSSFHVGALAQATIAATGLAASSFHGLRRGESPQSLKIEMRHAAVEFRSERYLRVNGGPPPKLWDAIAGLYRSGDDRWVRLHTNFPHHRDGLLDLLVCANEREAVQAALMKWEAEAFETAAAERGMVTAALRSFEEWDAHPQGIALASEPVLAIEKLGDASPERFPAGERPLSDIRVLDLTRIIAGPVGGRALAAQGAEVMRIAAPQLPSVAPLVIDSGRGKLSAFADLSRAEGRADLTGLLRESHVFLQGYRPGALAGHGFGPEAVAETRPGIVYASLSAYGHVGPWVERRGFDSLVQTASGFNHAEAQAAGQERPLELPCQALDHASGFLLAFGIIMALHRRAREGGSWHVKVGLATTGQYLRRLGRLTDGLRQADFSDDEVAPYLEESDSGFGRLTAVRHAAELSRNRPYWARPSMPLGSHPPRWAS